MRPKIIHEEVVSIVDEEVQGIQHLLVVAYQRHLQVLVHNLAKLRLGFVLFMDQLNLSLLVRLFQ